MKWMLLTIDQRKFSARIRFYSWFNHSETLISLWSNTDAKRSNPIILLIQHCPPPFSGIQKVHVVAGNQTGDQTHTWAIQAPFPDTAFSWVGFPA